MENCFDKKVKDLEDFKGDTYKIGLISLILSFVIIILTPELLKNILLNIPSLKLLGIGVLITVISFLLTRVIRRELEVFQKLLNMVKEYNKTRRVE